MGTKPAKVAHRPSWPTKAAKLGFFPETDELCAKRSSLRGRTKVAKVGPSSARGQCAKVPPAPYELCLLPPVPSVVVMSHSTVGLPRESKICSGKARAHSVSHARVVGR
eukprot:scaffold71844_cov46-Phaeocystis_antarctica.AAC.3